MNIYSKIDINHIVLSLILLAFLDSLFTDIGIRQNYITEANPIMKNIYDTSVFGFYALKISLPLFLLSLLSKIKPKKYLKVLLSSAVTLYTVVLFLHFFWISLAIIT
ncbi:DUF5658 family protein [Sporosarcina jiandibaonis]|uniref:DUF5658 family protein n=1 Tax=Sporosarcina jiandibaonis TaxID=2715535 RepID=UPI001557932C|nr:DUF5658 family protein [Sporosarcina jiandibaonis]